jgi:Putative transposase of IS4/5 family (DUF4096)
MRKPYPSDLTDEQWEIIKPLIPVNSVGRPRVVEMREVLNTIFYLDRSGWERSISFGSRGVPCCSRKCLSFKMVPASRLVVRT